VLGDKRRETGGKGNEKSALKNGRSELKQQKKPKKESMV